MTIVLALSLGLTLFSVLALSEDLSSLDQKRRDKFLLENLAILEQLHDPDQPDSLVAAPEPGWLDWIGDLGGTLFTSTPTPQAQTQYDKRAKLDALDRLIELRDPRCFSALLDISASGDAIIGKGENKEIDFALGSYHPEVMWKARKALVELRAIFSALELSMAAALFENEIELLHFQSRTKRGDLLTEHLQLIKDFKADADALQKEIYEFNKVETKPNLIAHHYKEMGLGVLKGGADIVRGLGRDTLLESPLPLIPTRLAGSMIVGIYHGIIHIPDEIGGIITGGAYGSYGETLGRQTLNTGIVVIPIVKGFKAYRASPGGARSGGEAMPFEIPDTLPEVWPTRPGGVPSSGVRSSQGISWTKTSPTQTAVLVLKPVRSSLKSSFEAPLQTAALPKTNPLSQLAADLFPQTAPSVFSKPYLATLLLLDQELHETRENVVGDPVILDQKEKLVFVRITRRDVNGDEIVVFVGWVTQEQYKRLKNSSYTIALASGEASGKASGQTPTPNSTDFRAQSDSSGSNTEGQAGYNNDYNDYLTKLIHALDNHHIPIQAVKAFLTRIAAATALLGEEFDETKKIAIERAHWVGEGQPGRNGAPACLNNYTDEQIAEKKRILQDAGFKKEQIKLLLDKGVCGISPQEAGKTPFEAELIKLGFPAISPLRNVLMETVKNGSAGKNVDHIAAIVAHALVMLDETQKDFCVEQLRNIIKELRSKGLPYTQTESVGLRLQKEEIRVLADKAGIRLDAPLIPAELEKMGNIMKFLLFTQTDWKAIDMSSEQMNVMFKIHQENDLEKVKFLLRLIFEPEPTPPAVMPDNTPASPLIAFIHGVLKSKNPKDRDRLTSALIDAGVDETHLPSVLNLLKTIAPASLAARSFAIDTLKLILDKHLLLNAPVVQKEQKLHIANIRAAMIDIHPALIRAIKKSLPPDQKLTIEQKSLLVLSYEEYKELKDAGNTPESIDPLKQAFESVYAAESEAQKSDNNASIQELKNILAHPDDYALELVLTSAEALVNIDPDQLTPCTDLLFSLMEKNYKKAPFIKDALISLNKALIIAAQVVLAETSEAGALSAPEAQISLLQALRFGGGKTHTPAQRKLMKDVLWNAGLSPYAIQILFSEHIFGRKTAPTEEEQSIRQKDITKEEILNAWQDPEKRKQLTRNLVEMGLDRNSLLYIINLLQKVARLSPDMRSFAIDVLASLFSEYYLKGDKYAYITHDIAFYMTKIHRELMDAAQRSFQLHSGKALTTDQGAVIILSYEHYKNLRNQGTASDPAYTIVSKEGGSLAQFTPDEAASFKEPFESVYAAKSEAQEGKEQDTVTEFIDILNNPHLRLHERIAATIVLSETEGTAADIQMARLALKNILAHPQAHDLRLILTSAEALVKIDPDESNACTDLLLDLLEKDKNEKTEESFFPIQEVLLNIHDVLIESARLALVDTGEFPLDTKEQIAVLKARRLTDGKTYTPAEREKIEELLYDAGVSPYTIQLLLSAGIFGQER